MAGHGWLPKTLVTQHPDFWHRNAGSKRWRKWLRRPSVVSSDRHCVVPWGCCEFQGEIPLRSFLFTSYSCWLALFFVESHGTKKVLGQIDFSERIWIPETSMRKHQNHNISCNPIPNNLYFTYHRHANTIHKHMSKTISIRSGWMW